MSTFWKICSFMRSILSQGCYWTNHCMEAMSTVVEARIALMVAFSTSVLLGSGVSQLPLDNSPTILCGVHVRRVGRPVKRSNTMVSKTVTSSFGTVGRCQARLGKGSMQMLISFSSRSGDWFADLDIIVYSIIFILCYSLIFWDTGFSIFMSCNHRN